jgi:hypothetical protein
VFCVCRLMVDLLCRIWFNLLQMLSVARTASPKLFAHAESRLRFESFQLRFDRGLGEIELVNCADATWLGGVMRLRWANARMVLASWCARPMCIWRARVSIDSIIFEPGVGCCSQMTLSIFGFAPNSLVVGFLRWVELFCL